MSHPAGARWQRPTSPPLRLLVLFQGQWETDALAALERSGEVTCHREGLELLAFPGCLRLLWFDARRFVDRLCERYRGRIDAVWSNDEQIGCLLAAVVAARLGLAGNDPAAILRAQHKLLLRQTLAARLAEATVPAVALPFRLGDRRCRNADAVAAAVTALGCSWPLFSKPVKGTFSAMARSVPDAGALAAHLRLSWLDRFVLTRLSRPFEQLARAYGELPCSADRMLLEPMLAGAQVNVDSCVVDGEVRVLGIVDEWMYADEVAGARHFAGFTLPSRHPAPLQQRLAAVAADAVRAVGLQRGLCNVELFVLADGSVRVIEVNPRAAGQFASMYRDVAGIDLERLAIALAAGRDPASVPVSAPVAGAAASFVFRRFDGRPAPLPPIAARQWLAAAHPRAQLWLEPASRGDLRREYRWLGSHRHAVLNHAAADFPTLLRDGAECAQRLFGKAPPPLL